MVQEKDRKQQKDINFISEVAAAVGAGIIWIEVDRGYGQVMNLPQSGLPVRIQSKYGG